MQPLLSLLRRCVCESYNGKPIGMRAVSQFITGVATPLTQIEPGNCSWSLPDQPNSSSTQMSIYHPHSKHTWQDLSTASRTCGTYWASSTAQYQRYMHDEGLSPTTPPLSLSAGSCMNVPWPHTQKHSCQNTPTLLFSLCDQCPAEMIPRARSGGPRVWGV